MISLGTALVPVGVPFTTLVHYSERVMKLEVSWQSDLPPPQASRSPGSQIVTCCVTPLMAVPRPLPPVSHVRTHSESLCVEPPPQPGHFTSLFFCLKPENHCSHHLKHYSTTMFAPALGTPGGGGVCGSTSRSSGSGSHGRQCGSHSEARAL